MTRFEPGYSALEAVPQPLPHKAHASDVIIIAL